jgi:hypothetical protein
MLWKHLSNNSWYSVTMVQKGHRAAGNARMSPRPALTPIRALSCVIVLILSSTLLAFAQPTTIDAFNYAKRLMEQVFAGR